MQAPPPSPLALRVCYRVVTSRFVPWHHPAYSALFNVHTNTCKHGSPLANAYARLPLAELCCRDDGQPCNGVAGMGLRLCEAAVRMRIERSTLRYLPFDFELSAPFDLERAQSCHGFVHRDLLEALLPLQLVHTPMLWLLIDGSGERLDAVVPSYLLYTKYRHILYTLHRASQNAMYDVNVAAAADPKGRPDPSAAARASEARASRIRTWNAAAAELFDKYAKLGTLRLRATRDELLDLKPGADPSEVLHRLTVRTLNVAELHLMELFNVEPTVRTELCTPLRRVDPAAWPRYAPVLDFAARELASGAATFRGEVASWAVRDARIAELAAALGAGRTDVAVPESDAPDAIKGAPGDLAALLAENRAAEPPEEPFDPALVPNDALAAVQGADDYNRLVLLPLLRGADDPESDTPDTIKGAPAEAGGSP